MFVLLLSSVVPFFVVLWGFFFALPNIYSADVQRLKTVFLTRCASVFRRPGAQAAAGRPDCGGGAEVKGHLWLLLRVPRGGRGLRRRLRHLPAHARKETSPKEQKNK